MPLAAIHEPAFGVESPHPPFERQLDRDEARPLLALESAEHQLRLVPLLVRVESVFFPERLAELAVEPVQKIVVIVVAGDAEDRPAILSVDLVPLDQMLVRHFE